MRRPFSSGRTDGLWNVRFISFVSRTAANWDFVSFDFAFTNRRFGIFRWLFGNERTSFVLTGTFYVTRTNLPYLGEWGVASPSIFSTRFASASVGINDVGWWQSVTRRSQMFG